MVRWGRTRRRQQRELENLRERLERLSERHEDSDRRIEELERREKLSSDFDLALLEHLGITPAGEEGRT